MPIDHSEMTAILGSLKKFATASLHSALFALALFLGERLLAEPTVDPGWLVTTWQAPDGLPNNNVEAITQTADGHLWLALPDAVARFDGVRFERFAPEDIGTPVGHRIRSMIRTQDDALWVVVDRDGIIRLKDGHMDVYAPAMPGRIDSISEDGEGAVWAAFSSAEFLRIKEGQVKLFSAAEGLAAGTRGSFATDTEGRIWFARGTQVGIYRDGRFQTIWRAPVAATRLARASAGGVWVSAGFRLIRLEATGAVHECGLLQPPTAAGEIAVMLEDRSGGLWLGSTTSGLVRYDGRRFENVPVSDREVRAIYEDQEGNIWVGTAGGGLNRIRQRGITIETIGANPGQDGIQALCEDSSGKLWGATSNGRLVEHTAEGWQTANARTMSAVAQAMTIASGPDGTLWIGTSTHQLHAWRDGRLKTWQADSGLMARTVRILCVAQNGDVWLGGEGPAGVQRLRDGQFTSLKLPVSVFHIHVIVEDAAGEIWIAADRATLLRVRGDEVIDESGRIAATTKSIRSLCFDENGNLWLGLGGEGVGCLRNGRFAVIRADRGLYEENVSQIVSDGRGWIWFGCDRGLFKVRQRELEAVVDGRASSVQSIFYGKDQGLPPLQAAYGTWPAAMRSRDGRLWVPMRSGVATIFPDRLRNGALPLPVVMKEVDVDDVAIASYDGPMPIAPRIAGGRANLQKAPAAKLEIPPGHRRLTFAFTALSMSAPESVQFRYRIVGFDENWSPPTTERQATYPRLDAGDYRFEAIARNSDGIWNKTGPAVVFMVRPFIWQTWWFRLLALTLFTGFVAAIVRYVSFRRLQANLRVLKEQAALDKERARIARDIHDDVGGRLTRIMLLTGLALRERKDPEKASARVGEIAVSARQVIKSLDETVWAINPRNDTLPDLVNYVGQFAVEFLRTADLACQVELPDHPPRRKVSAEARHNLFLAVKEALNNVVRHAGRCEVRVQIKVDSETLRITVTDDGAGFVAAANAPGADGLRNMHQRLEEIGGYCAVESSPGKGTLVSFVYPWPKDSGVIAGTTKADPSDR